MWRRTPTSGPWPRPSAFGCRLTKRGRYYAYASSVDGKSFRVHGELSWGTGAPKWIGLVAKNAAQSTAPGIDASFDSFEIRPRSATAQPVYRYTLPSSRNVDDLLKFIVDMRSFQPETPAELTTHNQRAPALLKYAAQRILQTETDVWSPAYQTGLQVMLADRVRSASRASIPQMRQALDGVKEFLKAKAEKGFDHEDLKLALTTAQAMESTTYDDLAADAYSTFAEMAATNKDEKNADIRQSLEGRCAPGRTGGQQVEARCQATRRQTAGLVQV